MTKQIKKNFQTQAVLNQLKLREYLPFEMSVHLVINISNANSAHKHACTSLSFSLLHKLRVLIIVRWDFHFIII